MLSQLKSGFLYKEQDHDTASTKKHCKMEDPVEKAARDFVWEKAQYVAEKVHPVLGSVVRFANTLRKIREKQVVHARSPKWWGDPRQY